MIVTFIPVNNRQVGDSLMVTADGRLASGKMRWHRIRFICFPSVYDLTPNEILEICE